MINSSASECSKNVKLNNLEKDFHKNATPDIKPTTKTRLKVSMRATEVKNIFPKGTFTGKLTFQFF